MKTKILYDQLNIIFLLFLAKITLLYFALLKIL